MQRGCNGAKARPQVPEASCDEWVGPRPTGQSGDASPGHHPYGPHLLRGQHSCVDEHVIVVAAVSNVNVCPAVVLERQLVRSHGVGVGLDRGAVVSQLDVDVCGHVAEMAAVGHE